MGLSVRAIIVLLLSFSFPTAFLSVRGFASVNCRTRILLRKIRFHQKILKVLWGGGESWGQSRKPSLIQRGGRGSNRAANFLLAGASATG
jgi:hypothetical protein